MIYSDCYHPHEYLGLELIDDDRFCQSFPTDDQLAQVHHELDLLTGAEEVIPYELGPYSYACSEVADNAQVVR